MVPKARKLFGHPFRTERGVTQGYLFSMRIFNIVVDGVVIAFLIEFYGTQEEHHGFGWATGEHKIVFYADYRRIAGKE